MTAEQKKSIESFTKITDDICMINYQNDYYLDELLEKGVCSVGDLLKFAAKKFTGGVNLFRKSSLHAGCTTFNCKTPDGHPLLCRNFDFKDAPCTVIWTHPENGYASISVTDNNMMVYGKKINPLTNGTKLQTLLAPYIPMDGVNEKGLSIAVLELKHPAVNQQYSQRSNIITTVMLRAILDKCADIDEAIAFFDKYNMHDSLFCAYHYQITDRTGRSVILEYDWTDGDTVINIYTPEDFGSKFGVQSCANFCVNKNIVNEAKDFGHERSALAFDRAERNGGVLDIEAAMNTLKDVRLTYKHEIYPWRVTTLWSVIYDVEDQSAYLCAGLKYDTIYKFSLTNPLSWSEQ